MAGQPRREAAKDVPRNLSVAGAIAIEAPFEFLPPNFCPCYFPLIRPLLSVTTGKEQGGDFLDGNTNEFGAKENPSFPVLLTL